MTLSPGPGERDDSTLIVELSWDDPKVFYTAFLAGLLIAGVVAAAATRMGAAWVPLRTWLIILPAIIFAVWLGAPAWTVFVAVVSMYGFKEYAKASGLYRERGFVVVVFVAIAGINLAAFLQRYDFFMAASMWAVIVLVVVPVVLNRTELMLQWLALSIVGVTLYAFFLSHLSWLYQSSLGLGYLLFVLVATPLNDVLAFMFGKAIGRRHWTNLSPNKTIEGSVLALVATIGLTFVQAPFAFPHVPPWGVLLAGLIIGVGGQLGDLMMALLKRNIGIKDWGHLLPGHGGLTDRLNSYMITAPVFAHVMGFLFGGFPQ
jgi:phosphatidate cytidylyltransferase